MYRGYDPSTTNGNGRKFVVPKRYVSQIDFLTPLRDLTNGSVAVELLDDDREDRGNVVINPHMSGVKKYGNNAWLEYKSGLTSYHGYVMIEYGWFYMDGISFAIEICVDHLVHRALMTYMADLVTGSNTRVPSSYDGVLEYVGIPKAQAQIQLVSSGGMGVNVESIAVANGGHIFLQDGIFGDLPPTMTFGKNPCNRNQYEFEGGSECVKRTAIISGEICDAIDFAIFHHALIYVFFPFFLRVSALHWNSSYRSSATDVTFGEINTSFAFVRSRYFSFVA
jgi:hypothetical protein